MAVTVSKSVAENWLHLDRELGTYVWGFIHNSLVEKSLMSSILFYPQNNANQQTYQRIRPKEISMPLQLLLQLSSWLGTVIFF